MVEGRVDGPILRPEVVDFVWKEEVEEKLLLKHGVSPREVQQVIRSDESLWYQKKGAPPNIWIVLGRTKTGRWLRVAGCIYEDPPKRGCWHTFSAFAATIEWQNMYRRDYRRIHSNNKSSR